MATSSAPAMRSRNASSSRGNVHPSPRSPTTTASGRSSTLSSAVNSCQETWGSSSLTRWKPCASSQRRGGRGGDNLVGLRGNPHAGQERRQLRARPAGGVGGEAKRNPEPADLGHRLCGPGNRRVVEIERAVEVEQDRGGRAAHNESASYLDPIIEGLPLTAGRPSEDVKLRRYAGPTGSPARP